VLAETIERWKAEFRQEGLQEGRREGQLLGARLLLRQLQKRFGELPAWVPPRVEQAPPAQLESWGERLFDVRSLDELFNGERNAAQDLR